MVIRHQQIEAMDHSMFLEYQRRLMVFYRERAPSFISRFSDAELKQRIGEAVPRARSFGLSSAEGILQYVGLALAAGRAFDEDPKVRELMTLPGSLPEVTLKRLLEIVIKNLNEAGDGTERDG